LIVFNFELQKGLIVHLLDYLLRRSSEPVDCFEMEDEEPHDCLEFLFVLDNQVNSPAFCGDR
jgi:hypothetical protein